uniref:Uncharacterized protein n=1 Tax=Lygus hesperus TaxID=30085 RepID=A0A146LTX6_LYGHE
MYGNDCDGTATAAPSHSSYRTTRGCATFVQQYSYVLVTDSQTCGINVFNTFDGSIVHQLPRLQTTPIESIAVNPVDNSFMICGFNDFRGHLYVPETSPAAVVSTSATASAISSTSSSVAQSFTPSLYV